MARTCAANLYAVNHTVAPTMMQPCASAAVFRDGGPILRLGNVAML